MNTGYNSNSPWSLVGVDLLSYFFNNLSSAFSAVSSSLLRFFGAAVVGVGVTGVVDPFSSGGSEPTVTVTSGEAAAAAAAAAAAFRRPRRCRAECWETWALKE